MADTPLRLSLRVLCIVASGTDVQNHPTVKSGDVTVIGALEKQARVINRVKVILQADADSFTSNTATVHFDRVVFTGKENVSLAAGPLGAVSIPLAGLEMDTMKEDSFLLISSTHHATDIRFEVRVQLTKTVMPAGKSTAVIRPRITGDSIPATPAKAVVDAAPVAATPSVERVVISFTPAPPTPAPPREPVAVVAPPPIAKAEEEVKVQPTPSHTTPDTAQPQTTKDSTPASVPQTVEHGLAAETAISATEVKPQTAVSAVAESTTVIATQTSKPIESETTAPSEVMQIPDTTVKDNLSGVIGTKQAESSGSMLPCRLVDYFGVMVSAEVPLPGEDEEVVSAEDGDVEDSPIESHPYDSDGVEDTTPKEDRPKHRSFRRRIGRLQYRYPKTDHEDVALPDSVDWFIFPNGISPIVQPTRSQSRPETRKSIFVLQNVAAGKNSATMYGCCLTAFRKEVDEDEETMYNEKTGQNADAAGTTLWWPVVLFMLSRYPIVPQLQILLEHVYNVYDAGTSTGAVESAALPKPYCALQEYLRMLVYEVPMPIRRLNFGAEVFLPGVFPSAAQMCRLQLPAPDSMPHIQFDTRILFTKFTPAKFLAAVAAVVLERKLIVIAQTVQELVEVSETLLGLIYPLQWELPFIPVLPAHLAADCLSNPVPFLYGLLSSYALRVLSEIDPTDAATLVIVDACNGEVHEGIGRYMLRRRDIMTKRGAQLPPEETDAEYFALEADAATGLLSFPEPLQSEGVAELGDVVSHLQSNPAATMQEANSKVQSFMLRFMAVLLHGYRTSTFFPGLPPNHAAKLCNDVFVETKTKALVTAATRSKTSSSSSGKSGESETTRKFISSISETQMLSALLQRHTSVYLRPFHSLTSLLSTSPSLSDCRKWSPPATDVLFWLTIPPPGYPLLTPWQANPTTHERLLPPANPDDLPPPHRQKRSKKEPKPSDLEVARKWLTGEVACALHMDDWDAQELETLVHRYYEGNSGPKGDDVGGAPESAGPTTMSETAAILAKATEAVGFTSNPVMRRRASSKPQPLKPPKKKEGTRWWRGGADVVEEPVDSSDMNDKLLKWLYSCLTTGTLPVPKQSNGAAASLVTNVNGIPWFADDDAIVKHLTVSTGARSNFVYALQTQILLAAGLSAPLARAIPGASLQLQPLLQLGVSPHTLETPWQHHGVTEGSKGQSGSSTARTLLIQYIPIARFQRLAAMCSALLTACVKTGDKNDLVTAAALLQVSFFFYTEPQKEASSAFAPVQAALSSRKDLPPGAGHAWNASRQYLYQELSAEKIWTLQSFWEIYISAALAVELQQQQLLHLQSQLRGGEVAAVVQTEETVALAANPAGTSHIFNLVSSIISPMLQLGFSAADLSAFIARVAKRYKMPVGEERLALSLMEPIVSAESSNNNGNQLNYYSVFNSGDAFSKAAALTVGSAPATKVSPAQQQQGGSTPTVPPVAIATTAATASPSPGIPPGSAAKAAPNAAEASPKPDVTPTSGPTSAPPAFALNAAAQGTADTTTTSSAAPDKGDAKPRRSSVNEGAPSTIEKKVSDVTPAAAGTDTAVTESTTTTTAAVPTNPPAQAPSTTAPGLAVEAVPFTPPTTAHPWTHLPPKEAEAAAKLLTAIRRFPPTADTSGKAKLPLDGDIAVPASGLNAALPVPVPGGATVKLLYTPDVSGVVKDVSKMPIVKKFGTMGLSVQASSFPAPIHGKSTAGDGSTVAIASSDEGLLDSALECATAPLLRSMCPSFVSMSCFAFRGHAPGASVTTASYDPTDHRVVTGGLDGRVTLWDMTTHDHVHTYEDHAAAITAIKLCGDVVISASQDGTVRLSSFARSAYGVRQQHKAGTDAAATGEFDDNESDNDSVTKTTTASTTTAPAATTTTPAAATTAGGAGDTAKTGPSLPFLFPLPTFKRNDAAGGKATHKFMSSVKISGHSGAVSAVDAYERLEEKKSGWFGKKTAAGGDAVAELPSTTNYVIVSGGTDGTVRTWSAKWKVDKRGRSSGEFVHLHTYNNLHKAGTIVEQVRLSSDGKLCASVGRDGRVGVIEVGTSKAWVLDMPTTTSKGLFGRKNTGAAAPDPIITPTGLPLVQCRIDVHVRPVTLTTAGVDGTVRVWDLKTGSVIVAFASGSPVWSFTSTPAHGGGAPTFAADGTLQAAAAPIGDYYLISGHEDGIVRKWDSRNPSAPMAQWRGHTAPITAMASYGDKLVTGAADGMVRIWDVQTGVSLQCDGHSGQVVNAYVCEDYFVTSSWDGTIRCWFPTT